MPWRCYCQMSGVVQSICCTGNLGCHKEDKWLNYPWSTNISKSNLEIHFRWRQSRQNQQGTGCCWDLAFIILIKRETGRGEGDKERGFSILLASTLKNIETPGQCILLYWNEWMWTSRDSQINQRRLKYAEKVVFSPLKPFATPVPSYVTRALLKSQKLHPRSGRCISDGDYGY